MRSISTLIDVGTVIKQPHMQVFIRYGYKEKYQPSGYVAFVVDGKLHQRTIRTSDKPLAGFPDTINYIVWKRVLYALDMPMKPISGAWRVEAFKA